MDDTALLLPGEKLHIMTRRLFADDLRRHFAGTVRAVFGTTVRIVGYTFVFNPISSDYRRRPEVRTRIFDLGDAGHIVNVIHPEAAMESLRYVIRQERLVITDDAHFSLDVNEFGSRN